MIADAGGTKTDWRIAPFGKKDVKAFQTEGINGSVSTEKHILATLLKLRNFISDADMLAMNGESRLYFYGAGCNSGEVNNRIVDAFVKVFPGIFGKIEIYSDILGAGRALFGEKEGIVSILGTGSASALVSSGEII